VGDFMLAAAALLPVFCGKLLIMKFAPIRSRIGTALAGSGHAIVSAVVSLPTD
jgi:hypothetical protein